MIKKHLKCYIYLCDLPKNFLEAATKENLRFYQRKSRYNYWSSQMEKLIAAVKTSYSHD